MLSHARPRTRTLSQQHMRRYAQHSPSHAPSHLRADTRVVAIKVERAMAYVAGHLRRAAELRLRENGVAMMLKREKKVS